MNIYDMYEGPLLWSMLHKKIKKSVQCMSLPVTHDYKFKQQVIKSLLHVRVSQNKIIYFRFYTTVCNVSNTRKCLIRYPNTHKWVEKTWHGWVFFNQLWGVRKSYETLFWVPVFDIASQSILKLINNNSWRNSKQKFTKFYDK